jgi:hypothetical protein
MNPQLKTTAMPSLTAGASDIDSGRLMNRQLKQTRISKALGALILLWTVVVWLTAVTVMGQGQTKGKPAIAPLLYSGTETGRFKILFGGEEIGQEVFQIVEESSGVKATAEIHLTVERENSKLTFAIRPALQFSRFFEPISYQVMQEAGSNKTRAQVNFKIGMSEASYDNGTESDTRQIELRKDVIVLDDNVFHQYIILAKRYDFTKGGVQEFSAFVPQQFIAGRVSVSDKGMETVQTGSKSAQLQHLLVDTGELQISLWLDETHRLLKLAVPKSKGEVVRD